MVGSHPGAIRATPLPRGGLADPLAEGIHKDTDGPDQASDRVQYVAHLPGRYLALADVCASAFRLGHGPRVLVTKVDAWLCGKYSCHHGVLEERVEARPHTRGH